MLYCQICKEKGIMNYIQHIKSEKHKGNFENRLENGNFREVKEFIELKVVEGDSENEKEKLTESTEHTGISPKEQSQSHDGVLESQSIGQEELKENQPKRMMISGSKYINNSVVQESLRKNQTRKEKLQKVKELFDRNQEASEKLKNMKSTLIMNYELLFGFKT